MNTDEDLEFLKHMSRHLVALTSEYKSYQNGNLLHHGVLAFSGFTIEMQDRWFWVTAGHCLKMLDENIPAKTMELFRTEFMDCFGPGQPVLHGVPFTYEPGCGFFIEKRHLALDFGVIPLPDLYRQNMVTNGVVAISRNNWERQSELTFSEYRILGFPADDKVETFDASGGAEAEIRPVMMVIDRIEQDEINDPPGGAWFIGRIPDDIDIRSVEGMSGGPIFGFRMGASGQWHYQIVALQSWWRPDSRIIFGCSLPLFAEVVQNALENEAKGYLGEPPS